MRLIAPKDFNDVWGYKYVRFADGRVLFCDSGDMCSSHKQIVDEHPEAPPVSAGQIKVRYGKWVIESGGSITAKLRRMESDEKYIARELGPAFEHDVEVFY